MCYTIPILKTEEEFWSLDDTKSVNEITEVPENFREWIKDNTDRIEKAEARGTLPYFIKDNRGFVEEVLDKDVAKQPEITRIETNRREYNLLGLEWEKVCFNEKTGGYNVYHESHQFAPQKAEKIVDGRKIKSKLSGGDAEKYVGRILCDLNGKRVRFIAENGKSQWKPDIECHGEPWDIKYSLLANENTIRKYIKDAEKAQNVIFFWDGEDRKNSLYNAVNSELGNYRKKGKIDRMPKVYYISLEGKLKKLNVQT